MDSRALLVLTLAVSALPAWGACPADPVPPDVPQLIDEIGARPTKLIVGEVRLANVSQATVEEQKQITAQVTSLCFFDGKSSDVNEAVVEAFQDRGFFRAQVSRLQIDILNQSAAPPTVAVVAYMQEGFRYRLKAIEFTGNKAVANISLLRAQFKINDGDVFRPEAVREGIRALRKLYAAAGYINLTPVPDARVDDKNHAIVMKFDVDEGRQFAVRSFTILGADPQREAALRAGWKPPPGSIFNGDIVDNFFAAAKDLLPVGATRERNLDYRQDQSTLDIVLDLRDSR